MLFVTVLSVATGSGGCGWSISDSLVRMDVAFCQFSNHPPNSASVYDDMTFLMMIHSTCTGLFYGGISVIGVLLMGLGPKKHYPHALLNASGSEI